MILYRGTRYRRESAHIWAGQISDFSGASFCGRLNSRPEFGMRRRVLAFYYRYPSPSLWSGPFWVRPDFIVPAKDRQGAADLYDLAIYCFEICPITPHMDGIKPIYEGGVGCRLSNYAQLSHWSQAWPDASTTIQNVPSAVRRQVPLRPAFWTPTLLQGRPSVARPARCVTTRAYVTDQRPGRCNNIGTATGLRRGGSLRYRVSANHSKSCLNRHEAGVRIAPARMFSFHSHGPAIAPTRRARMGDDRQTVPAHRAHGRDRPAERVITQLKYNEKRTVKCSARF